MSEYTPEDLVRLISIPGVTVEEIRLALNLPLEGFLGLVMEGPLQEEAFEEVKKAAIEAFGKASSQKLMVVSDNWTIEPLTEAQLEQASWSNDRPSRKEEKAGWFINQFAPIRREVWDDEYWASLTDEQRRELGWVPIETLATELTKLRQKGESLQKTLDDQRRERGWVPNKSLQEQMDKVIDFCDRMEDGLLRTNDEVLKHEYDLTYGHLTKSVEIPSGPGRIYRANLDGVDGTVYHSEHKLEDLDKAIQARQNAIYRSPKIDDPAWWEFVRPAPKITTDGKLYTDAANAIRYYDNAKKEARQDEASDDFDKTVTWVKPSEKLQLAKEWIPKQTMLGCSMTDATGWIFFGALMFCAASAVVLGIASFGNYFFGWW